MYDPCDTTNQLLNTKAKGAPGRKVASECRASEIRARLVEWRRTAPEQRVSLRTLGVQLGISHQLLSFYLKRLDRWQREEERKEERKGYKLKAQEIFDRAKAEHRYMTEWEQAQYMAYQRASLRLLLDSIGEDAITHYRKDFRKCLEEGDLSGVRGTAKLLALLGNREAQQILNARSRGSSENQKNNLPVISTGAAKSFRTA